MLMRKTVMISPSILLTRGVPVYRATQRPRELIVTFPKGYHSGFNHGFHTGEAINFAMPDWIPYGLASLQRYRAVGWLSVIDMEKLTFDIARHLAQFEVRLPADALPAPPASSARNLEHDKSESGIHGSGEEGSDGGVWQRVQQRRPAVDTPDLLRLKDGSSTGTPSGAEDEGVKSLDWTALIERKSVTAVLWAIRAFVRRVI